MKDVDGNELVCTNVLLDRLAEARRFERDHPNTHWAKISADVAERFRNIHPTNNRVLESVVFVYTSLIQTLVNSFNPDLGKMGLQCDIALAAVLEDLLPQGGSEEER